MPSPARNTALSNNKLKVVADTVEMQRLCLAARRAGKRISFVPTMGYLHEGHLSLMREGRQRGDLLVLSIFVNPTQFGPNEDLDKYPRDFQRDQQLALEAGVDLIFLPTPDSMYPQGYGSYVSVEGGLTDLLEGASRSGHFRGVATVVAKLFNIVQPDVALFGRKDFQQLAVIRRMTTDLNLPVEIVAMPIVREADGLAMSSRNVYLSPRERQQALSLNQALQSLTAQVAEGETDALSLVQACTQRLLQEPDLKIDYVQICHQQTLCEQSRVDADSVLLLAVLIGKTRLIDNGRLFPDEPDHG